MEEVAFELRPDELEGAGTGQSWGEYPASRNGPCKGPEEGMCLAGIERMKVWLKIIEV